MQNWGEALKFYLAKEVGKFEDFLAEKKVTLSWLMNSDMVKLEKIWPSPLSLLLYSTFKYSSNILEV